MSKDQWEQPELPFDPPISRPDPMRRPEKWSPAKDWHIKEGWNGGNVRVSAYPIAGASIESRLRTLEKDVQDLRRMLREIHRRLG